MPSATSDVQMPVAAPSGPPPPEAAPVYVEAATLWSAYDANTVAADEAFKGRRVYVRSTVERVVESMGTYDVYLEVPGQPYSSIIANFGPEFRSRVAQLGKGSSVAVTGVCNGEMMGNVSLDQCTFGQTP